MQQVLSSFCLFPASKSHPASKFAWGNLASIKSAPAAKGVDAYELLWDFYRAHYSTADLKVAVLSSHTLEELEKAATEAFGEISKRPDTQTDERVVTSALHGLPFEEEPGRCLHVILLVFICFNEDVKVYTPPPFVGHSYDLINSLIQIC